MLAIFGAIKPLPKQINVLKKKVLTRIFPDLRSQNLCLFNAPKTLKPLTGLGKTIETIVAIEKIVVIMAFANLDLQALPQLLGSIQPIFLFQKIVISYLDGMTKT